MHQVSAVEEEREVPAGWTHHNKALFVVHNNKDGHNFIPTSRSESHRGSNQRLFKAVKSNGAVKFHYVHVLSMGFYACVVERSDR